MMIYAMLFQMIQFLAIPLPSFLARVLLRKRRRFLHCHRVQRRRFRTHRRLKVRRCSEKKILKKHGKQLLFLMLLIAAPYWNMSCPLCDKGDRELMSQFLSRHIRGIVRHMSFLQRWTISRRTRNRLVHMRNGNTYSHNAASSSKGRGKSKSKAQSSGSAESSLSPEMQEEIYRKAIQNAMPEAAKRRLAPRLLPAEWNSPVLHYSEMTNAGGICIAPKHCVPELLQQIGYTQAPAAMLCTQHPQELGLPLYPVQELTCTFLVKEDDGTEKSILVRRHLVQLGFGKEVTQNVTGDLVSVPTHMHKVVIKLPFIFGWRQEACTAQTFAKFLEKHIPAPAYENITVRQDQSATVYVHESEIEKLLRASGLEGIFVKLHASSNLLPNADILWLPPEVSLDEANQLAQNDASTIGVVSKNSKVTPRFAVRFSEQSKLQHFAKANHIEDLSIYSRWRLTGLPVQTGALGALQLLESRGWDVKEILYFTPSQCNFLASNRGNTADMHYVTANGSKHPLQLKAVNSKAKEAQAAENKAAAAKAQPKVQPTRPQQAQLKSDWLREMAARSRLQEPASPRRSEKNDPNKRNAESKTGNTPEAAKQRTA